MRTQAVSVNTKWSMRLVVFFGFVKVLTLLLYVSKNGKFPSHRFPLTKLPYRISIAGLVVLGGHTRVVDPKVNWRDPWEGTSGATAYGATNAMVKLVFSYAGYTNAFSVVNEIKVIRTMTVP